MLVYQRVPVLCDEVGPTSTSSKCFLEKYNEHYENWVVVDGTDRSTGSFPHVTSCFLAGFWWLNFTFFFAEDSPLRKTGLTLGR